MIRFFLLLFVAIPVVEVWLLIKVGGEIGALFTLAWLILAGIFGINLIRYQGAATLMNMRQQLSMGQPPAQAVINGMLLAVAGVLLIIPGFFSDFIALLLILPPVRGLILKRWSNKAKVRERGAVYDAEPQPSGSSQTPKAGLTLEGEFKREDTKRP